MNTRQDSYLKNNFSDIEKILRETFKASSDSKLITGTIVHIEYCKDNCGFFCDLDPDSVQPSKNYGPGIRIRANFGDETKNYFYPENNCTSLESFLDEINTDFGMAQIMKGKSTASLNITWYDLEEDKIEFKLNGEVHEVEGFKNYWDVNTLTFNVKAFVEMRAPFNKASDFNSRSISTLRAFPSPDYPASVTVKGINKNEFLNEHTPSFNK